MSNINESPNDEINPWSSLWHRLHTTRREPLPTDEEVDALMATLPKRFIWESLSQWLERTRQARKQGGLLKSPGKFNPITTFVRYAASSGTEDYPLPSMPIETKDFRLTVTKIGNEIQIHLEALNYAKSHYSQKKFSLYGNLENKSLVAEINTDINGSGFAMIPDKVEVRKALMRAELVEI